MKSNKSCGRRLRRVLSTILIICIVSAYGYWNRTGTTKARNCRVCAASFDHRTVFVYGIPVWSWDTETLPRAETKNYFDRYLAYRHEHEWTGGGYSRYGRGFVGCGSSSFGPYPQHQLELTRMGLQLVAASGIDDPEVRRRYFQSIIHPAGGEHYWRVIKTCDMIYDQIPKEPWEKWASYRIWGPDMKDIKIPQYVRAGMLAADPLCEVIK